MDLLLWMVWALTCLTWLSRCFFVGQIFLVFLICVFCSGAAGAFETRYYTGSLNECQGRSFAPVYGAEFCGLASYVQKNILPLGDVLNVVYSDRVVLFGDTHPHLLLKSWLIRNFAVFKDAGFTSVGFEFLNSDHQELVNRYRSDRSLKPSILKMIVDEWGWIPEAHLALLDAAFDSGFQVVALDGRLEVERKKIAESKQIQFRNEHMARLIQGQLTESPSDRMLVLTGKVHSALVSDEGEMTLPAVLKSQGVSVLSLDLESGEALVPRLVTQAFVLSLLSGVLPASSKGDYILSVPGGTTSDGIIFITR